MRPSWREPEVTLVGPGRGGDFSATAAEFGLREAPDAPGGWLLDVSPDRIQIRPRHLDAELTLDLDARSSGLLRRLRTARRTDPLARAFGLHRRQEALHLVDATAGLARDTLMLAQLGCRIDAVERVPALAFVAHLLARETGLDRLVTVHAGDAVAWLEGRDEDRRPDAVYLDPMFEEPGKAQVKKDMQVCRLLAGPADGDPARLLAVARAVARERVVVKRHHGAAPLGAGVAFEVPGERIRFDVYLTAPAPPG
ncbi:MAG: class I SAM-dependent methyltransferase [Planctomycetes bacterium]|nr:class I SAM-dependent methyltransferase [Planctomycetota bacterium]